MRISRFTVENEIHYGVVQGEGEDQVVVPIAGDPFYSGIQPIEGASWKVQDVRLLAPVIPRSKIVCVGRNYADHAAEMGNELPTSPMLFFKPNTSVVGPGDRIFHPPQSQDVHYEGELAVVAFWVDPAARGRGVGRALLDHLERRARARGAVAMTLEVADANEAAVRLYAAAGFEPTGRTGAFGPPREHVTEHERRKLLLP